MAVAGTDEEKEKCKRKNERKIKLNEKLSELNEWMKITCDIFTWIKERKVK